MWNYPKRKLSCHSISHFDHYSWSRFTLYLRYYNMYDIWSFFDYNNDEDSYQCKPRYCHINQ